MSGSVAVMYEEMYPNEKSTSKIVKGLIVAGLAGGLYAAFHRK